MLGDPEQREKIYKSVFRSALGVKLGIAVTFTSITVNLQTRFFFDCL